MMPSTFEALKTMHILLAEDDKNFGQVLKKELEEERYSIDLVQDGLEAVLGFIDKPCDLVLLDIAMPKLDGINALRIIKKISPHVPVIAFSGNAGAEKMQDALQAGAMTCLTKPFKIDKLKQLIQKQIA
jgi:CheY-like chemotaxis protein